jgi:predicted TIM-barrel fold metal-dependent hydrolase
MPADYRRDTGGRVMMGSVHVQAEWPSVAVKISGPGSPGQPGMVEVIGPLVRDAIAVSGVDRCMFAGKLSVDRLVGGFDRIRSGLATAAAVQAEIEKNNLLHDNAIRF